MQFEPEQKKLEKNFVVMRAMTKKLNIRFSCQFILYQNRKSRLVQMQTLEIAREIDFLCLREVNAMLIVSPKIQEREGRIWPSSFYGQLPDY